MCFEALSQCSHDAALWAGLPIVGHDELSTRPPSYEVGGKWSG